MGVGWGGVVGTAPDGDPTHDNIFDGQREGARRQSHHHHRPTGTYHLVVEGRGEG